MPEGQGHGKGRVSMMFLDGKFVSTDEKIVNDLTPGQRRLDGVFETLYAHKGKITDLERHLKRLADGTKCLKIKNPLPEGRWKTVLRRLLKVHPYTQARLRILVWREDKMVHAAALVLKYIPPARRQYTKGIKVMTVKSRRPASSRWARVKYLDYTAFVQAYQRAIQRGFEDALLVNAKGHVVETSRANIFVLCQGVVMTPPLNSGCLDGTMRAHVIDQARKHKIPLKQRNLTVNDIIHSDGAFVTNSLVGLLPLASIDGQALKFPDLRLALLGGCRYN